MVYVIQPSTLDTGQMTCDLQVTLSGVISFIYSRVYRVAQTKIPHQTICNIFATSGQILKILEDIAYCLVGYFILSHPVLLCRT